MIPAALAALAALLFVVFLLSLFPRPPSRFSPRHEVDTTTLAIDRENQVLRLDVTTIGRRKVRLFLHPATASGLSDDLKRGAVRLLGREMMGEKPAAPSSPARGVS